MYFPSPELTIPYPAKKCPQTLHRHQNPHAYTINTNTCTQKHIQLVYARRSRSCLSVLHEKCCAVLLHNIFVDLPSNSREKFKRKTLLKYYITIRCVSICWDEDNKSFNVTDLERLSQKLICFRTESGGRLHKGKHHHQKLQTLSGHKLYMCLQFIMGKQCGFIAHLFAPSINISLKATNISSSSSPLLSPFYLLLPISSLFCHLPLNERASWLCINS